MNTNYNPNLDAPSKVVMEDNLKNLNSGTNHDSENRAEASSGKDTLTTPAKSDSNVSSKDHIQNDLKCNKN